MAGEFVLSQRIRLCTAVSTICSWASARIGCQPGKTESSLTECRLKGGVRLQRFFQHMPLAEVANHRPDSKIISSDVILGIAGIGGPGLEPVEKRCKNR
ncbi:unnamed protein product [Caenorhabditis auriculariae]|uniref:Uncharacterized protein n=1 Tax=Caenorhabditis auriculariae TaxID=2777116 RepID=A0A8S1HWU5_9PELO|nr:unnamed protein product [Caenorhabditis auriculariae]